MSAIPYSISFDQKAIDRLKQKLALADFPDELEDAGWDYGAPLNVVKRLAATWKDGFDFQALADKLNKLPNYHTTITVDGFEPINLHFVHQQSDVAGAIPLLFAHGWPGSFLEVERLLPLLKGGDGKPAFHVVALSHPNFGFSSGTKKKGFGLRQYAETCHKLMVSLGYNKYVTQGGDWGFYITRMMGLLYPKHCVASHINMVRAFQPTLQSSPLLAIQHAVTPYSDRDRKGLARTKWFLEQGSGYRLTQSTKPQTIGYSLTDSPVGLLAWIFEKLHDWTDEYDWSDDEILTWVSLYYFSACGPAAAGRIYYEATHGDTSTGRDRTQQWIGKVPLGLAYFPKELGVLPKTWGRTLGPVVFEKDHPAGGHFAAWEVPESIASDLNTMFGKKGPCAGIIKGKTGY